MKIVMCCTTNWLHYLWVSLYSLLETNKVEKIYLFLEVDSVEELTFFKNRYNVDIEIINYKKIINNYLSENNKNKFTQYSEATLVRLIISKILSEDKIIYIDVDAIVINDISSLWKLDIKKYYVAGVLDLNIKNFLDYILLKNIPEDSINAGILVMNLKAIRENSVDDKCLELLEKDTYRFPDQDVINIVCHDHILYIDNEYNSSLTTGFSDNAKIMHYASTKKDWVKGMPYDEIWYNWEKSYLKALSTNDDHIDSSSCIDLIMPAYNCHQHIRKALDSVVKQTIKDKIKVTIVNDGSKEDYSSIIEEYKQVLNIREITLKKNGGIAKALQKGVDSTNSEYILALDSDDIFYDEKSVKSLYNVIEKNPNLVKVSGKVMTEKGLNNYLTYIHGKIFRRSFIKKHKIKFIPLYLYEDLAYNLSVDFLCDEKMQEFCDKAVYVYYLENEGAITSVKKDYIRNVDSFIKAYEYALKKSKTKKGYFYANKVFSDLTEFHSKINKKKLSESEYIEFIKLCKKFYKKHEKYIGNKEIEFIKELENW